VAHFFRTLGQDAEEQSDLLAAETSFDEDVYSKMTQASEFIADQFSIANKLINRVNEGD